MNIVTSGAVAALFIGACMGSTLTPSAPTAIHARQAARLVVDHANTGLLASASVATRPAG